MLMDGSHMGHGSQAQDGGGEGRHPLCGGVTGTGWGQRGHCRGAPCAMCFQSPCPQPRHNPNHLQPLACNPSAPATEYTGCTRPHAVAQPPLTAGQHRQLPLPRANLGLALPAPCPCWVVSILSLGAPLACAPSPKPAHSSGRRLRWPVAPCPADSVPLQGQLRSPIWHHQPRQVPIAPRHQCHCAPCWGYKSPHPSQPTPVPPDQQGLNAPLLSKGETGWAVKEIK